MIGIALGIETAMNRAREAAKEERKKEAKIAEERRLEILTERADPEYNLRLQRKLMGLHPDKDFETFEEYISRRWDETMRDDDFMRMYYMDITKKHNYDYAKKYFANTLCKRYTKLYSNHPNYKKPIINKLSKKKKQC